MKLSRENRPNRFLAGTVLIAFVVLWSALPTDAQDTTGPKSSIQEYVHFSTPELAAKLPVGADERFPKMTDIVLPRDTGFGMETPTEKATVVVLDEDFESEDWGDESWFFSTAGGVSWGDSSYRSHSGNWSAWCVASGVNAEPPGGPYANDTISIIVYGPIDLSDAVGGSISFNMWYDIEERSYDYISWLVSTDLDNWYGAQEGGTSNGWERRDIDFTDVPGLGDVTGQSTVYLAFSFLSDGSIVKEGAYIDDLYITKQTAAGTCIPSPTTMCLRENRFEVEINYRLNNGTTGDAFCADPDTVDSGLFYYTNPNNWEFLVKILNGCPVNNRYWVFFAATTNQEFTVTVTDTLTDEQVTYFNPLGQSADAVTDTAAFATCP